MPLDWLIICHGTCLVSITKNWNISSYWMCLTCSVLITAHAAFSIEKRSITGRVITVRRISCKERAWMCCWLSDSIYTETAIPRLCFLPNRSFNYCWLNFEKLVRTPLFGRSKNIFVTTSFDLLIVNFKCSVIEAYLFVTLMDILMDFKCLSWGPLLLFLNTTESGNESLVERELHSPMRSSSNQYYSWKKTPFQ